MAVGLSLRTGVSAGYSPMTPVQANSPTQNAGSRPGTVTQVAFGVSGAGAQVVNPIPAYGAVGVGIVATIILAYMYWTLPR